MILYRCDNISTHKVRDYCTMLGVSFQQQDIVMSKESFVYVINELESLKTAVKTLQKQFTFVTSFLGIAENSLSLSNDDFPALQKGGSTHQTNTSSSHSIVDANEAARKAHNHNKLGLHRHMLVLPVILLH